MNEQGENPSHESSEDAAREAVLRRIVERAVQRWLLRVPENADRDATETFLLGEVERATALFPEKAEEFSRMIAEIKHLNLSSGEDICSAIAERLNSFLKRNFSIEELETRLRGELALGNEWKSANRLVMYEISGGKVHLHIPLVVEENISTLRQLFLEGLRELAQLLKVDPELGNVTEINGRSWIVYEHPKLLERMGFTITERDDVEHTAKAIITKEHLIDLYT